MQVLRMGFIGLGGIATRSHLPALAKLPDVTVQAGAELNPTQAERTRKRFGIPKIYASYQEMLEEQALEAVYVCLPNALHYEAAAAALERGLHVYCEKPMGVSVAQAAELCALAERRKLVLMPGYNLRFRPTFQRARLLIQQGRIGKILQIHAAAMHGGPYIGWDPKSDWYFDARNGGVLYDWGSHLLDLLIYVTGLDIEVFCAAARPSLPGLPTADNVAAAFRAGENAVGALNLGWGAPGNLTMLQIHGTAGSVVVSDDHFEHRTARGGGSARLMTLLDNLGTLLGQTGRSLAGRQASGSLYVQASANFVAAIRGRAPLQTSAADGVKVHRALEALRACLHESGARGW